jgi:phosphoribosyl-ATP pyrophosphohydrolase
MDEMFTLDDLSRLIAQRAEETAIAAVAQDDAALRAEAADVLYHLLVLLQARGMPLAEVLAELERRTQRSGLEEKASRRA